MDKFDIVREAYSFSISPEEKAQYYADDFQAVDELGSPPIDKPTWIGMGGMFEASIPDIDFIIENMWEEGDSIMVEGHFTGTFANDLDLSAMGLGVISATGETVTWPTGTAQVTLRGDQVVENLSLGTGPDAGMAGFLRVLGVDMG